MKSTSEQLQDEPHTRQSKARSKTKKQMPPVDIKEISPRNRAQHARRLRKLKRSVERHSYQIDTYQLAGDMIHEAYSYETARRLVD